jgi:hypothetical protein
MRRVLTRAAQRVLGKISRSRRWSSDWKRSRPFSRHRNVERIKGERDAFRLREGDWRATYRIDREAGEMRVLVVEPRGTVYR